MEVAKVRLSAEDVYTANSLEGSLAVCSCPPVPVPMAPSAFHSRRNLEEEGTPSPPPASGRHSSCHSPLYFPQHLHSMWCFSVMLNLAPENLSRDDDTLLRQIAVGEGRASVSTDAPWATVQRQPYTKGDSSQLIVTYWGQSVLVAAVAYCSMGSLLYAFERTPCGPTVSFRTVTETLPDICNDPLSKTTYPSSLVCRLDAQG